MSGMTVTVFLLTMFAGALGAVCRFMIDTAVKNAMKHRYGADLTHSTPRLHRLMNKWPKFEFLGTVPLGTVAVNVSACLLVGLLAGVAVSAVADQPWFAPFHTILSTGFLGGYSTFSTASLEGFRLFESGHPLKGIAHAGGMLIASLIMVVLGFALGKLL